MEPTINKPKVFLSHSHADKPFIENLKSDFERYGIEPWLDTEAIDHGEPWLKAIFEYGIPSCSAVLVYFTESSINSKVVEKEIDAGMLHKLDNNNVAFLPYVSDEVIRDKLRTDIRTLNVPVWNDENYEDLLPKVVGQIWKSFVKFTVFSAIQNEENKRLKVERELQELKDNLNQTIFSPSEQAEFKYIWGELDKFAPVKVKEMIEQQETIEREKIHQLHVKISTIVPLLAEVSSVEFDSWVIRRLIENGVKRMLSENSPDLERRLSATEFPDLTNQLLLYDLIEQQLKTDAEQRMQIRNYRSYKHVYTRKYNRFRFWLKYYDTMPSFVEFSNDPNTPST